MPKPQPPAPKTTPTTGKPTHKTVQNIKPSPIKHTPTHTNTTTQKSKKRGRPKSQPIETTKHPLPSIKPKSPAAWTPQLTADGMGMGALVAAAVAASAIAAPTTSAKIKPTPRTTNTAPVLPIPPTKTVQKQTVISSDKSAFDTATSSLKKRSTPPQQTPTQQAKQQQQSATATAAATPATPTVPATPPSKSQQDKSEIDSLSALKAAIPEVYLSLFQPPRIDWTPPPPPYSYEMSFRALLQQNYTLFCAITGMQQKIKSLEEDKAKEGATIKHLEDQIKKMQHERKRIKLSHSPASSLPPTQSPVSAISIL